MGQLMPSFLVCRGLNGHNHHGGLKCWLTFSHGRLSSRCLLDHGVAGGLATLGVSEPPPQNRLLAVDGLPELLQALLEVSYARAWSENGSTCFDVSFGNFF